MTPEQFRRAEQLYFDALELSPEERRGFLDSACADDDEVRDEVVQLLAQQEATIALGPQPEDDPPVTHDDGVTGRWIGRYHAIRQIGEGGMGVVYEAEQEEPIRRRVALKVIKLGMDTRQIVARFEAERQTLALMDHANIAKVFDAGATEQGQPYFAMEYVQGERITKYCDEQCLTTRERLALFVQVCQAIQHAHQKGIIHRDIKPSNVLVSTQDGRPIPKVIDFGVAKATDHRLTEKTLFTEAGQFVGTPEYMSPEQAGLGEPDIDTRTDVYSLGVLLYELLVGALPYGPTYLRSRDIAEIQRVIREEEPPRPSTRLAGLGPDSGRCARQRRTAPHALRRQLRGDLDWITMKALEKDRTRRYSSAADLAADIGRHLKHEPVGAGPPNKVYQVRKFVRRNRGLVAGAAAVFALLVVGAVAFNMFAIAQTRAQAAQRLAYIVTITAAHETILRNDVAASRQHLEAASPELRNWEWHYLQAACDESLVTPRELTGPVLSVAIDPDGRLLASGSADGTISIWDLAIGVELCFSERQTEKVNAVAFSPDGRLLASALADGTVRVWDVLSDSALALRHVLEGHAGRATSVAFRPDGGLLASGAADDTIRLWDPFTGEQLDPLELEDVEPHPWGTKAYVANVAFSPDGKCLAAGSWCDKSVRLWDLDTGELLWRRQEHRGGVGSVAFSPDGQYLAAASQDHGIYIWTIAGDLWRILRGHTAAVLSVAFDPVANTLRLISASEDATVRIWDASGNEQLQVMRGHEDVIFCAIVTPDGTRVVSASYDKTIRIWDASDNHATAVLGKHRDEVWSVAFSPDGARLASGGLTADPTIRIWDVGTGEMLPGLAGHTRSVRSVVFSPDGTRLASASDDTTARVWNAYTGQQLLCLEEHSDCVRSVAFSPDDTRLASGSWDRTVRIWDARTGGELLTLRGHSDLIHSVAFSPDGTHLVSASKDKTVRLWDAASGDALEVLNGHEDEVLTVAFSPDGTRLASGSMDTTVHIWNATNGDELMVLRGSAGYVRSVAFSPDGRRLAAASKDKTVHMWDAHTGEEVLHLRGHTAHVHYVAFSPDGARLASGAGDWAIHLWDTVPYRDRYQERQAILAARPEAEGIVDALWTKLDDAKSVAQRLHEDASLSDSVRRAALNLVLQRATHQSEPLTTP